MPASAADVATLQFHVAANPADLAAMESPAPVALREALIDEALGDGWGWQCDRAKRRQDKQHAHVAHSFCPPGLG